MSMKIPLSDGSSYAIIDDEDCELVSRFKWNILKQSICSYATCAMYIGRINKKEIMTHMKMHRLIMRPPKGIEIDHINYNGLDNRRSNMRICTRLQNIVHTRKREGFTSIYKGVSKARNRWRATIKTNGKKHHLGMFDNEMDAAKVYDDAAKKAWGEFAFVNFAS